MLLKHLFNRHPHSIGETYLQHQRHAFGFGGTMVLAGLACILHGLLPAIFTSTGSRAITRLYDRMVLNRSRQTQAAQIRGLDGAINPCHRTIPRIVIRVVRCERLR
jgi:hypothetical protein